MKKLEENTKRLNMVVPASLVEKVDSWRSKQPDLPNASEAFRRLVEIGLEASRKGNRHGR
jgi:metal-responsive CopG/Arc/MetJ family transcriptional regulator